MGEQIRFFDKSKMDLENPDVQITVTDAVASNNGQDFVDFLRNRNNFSAWMTTESTDAANTTLEISMGDAKFIDSLFLVGHNLKAYTIQYKKGIGSYLDFSTIINPTNDTESTTFYEFTQVEADTIKIIITGTQVADADKIVKQIIATKTIGQFAGWPVIKNAQTGTGKRVNRMLSQKVNVVETLESFKCTTDVRHWKKEADISLIQTLYFLKSGFLMWINANDPTQFFSDVRGYRKQDIYLMRPTNEFKGDYVAGVYSNGLKQSIRFEESIN